MYTDTLFNFWQITENEGIEEGSEILSKMAKSKPTFALDAGIRADDIYARVERIKECIAAIENDENRCYIQKIIHFAAGIMGDSDSVENRFEYVENLENTINDFKASDDEYASRLVAIGPCGIDHDWDSVEYEGRDHEYFDSHMTLGERDLFALQLTLAKKLNMPLILHSRKGFKDTSDVLKAVKWNKGVVHGYSYSKAELDFFLDLGWYISFSGSVTYSGKKAALDMAETVAYVPKDRILIETDSPYYAPVPLKNTYNNPNNINYIYEYVASKRGLTASKLSSIVDANCEKLFSL